MIIGGESNLPPPPSGQMGLIEIVDVFSSPEKDCQDQFTTVPAISSLHVNNVTYNTCCFLNIPYYLI